MDYNESIAIENFIDFCDDMQIANEGLLSSIKNALVGLLKRLISTLRGIVSRCRNEKTKTKFTKMLDKVEGWLNKSNNSTNEQELKNITSEAENLQKDLNEHRQSIEKAIRLSEENLAELRKTNNAIKNGKTYDDLKMSKKTPNKWTADDMGEFKEWLFNDNTVDTL